MDHTEKAYTSKEVSLTLGIGDSTLRKWCMALEKNGYHFWRNEHNQRSYTEKDIVALRHFQTMVQRNNFSLDNAGMVIAAKFSEGALPNESGGVPAIVEEESRSLMRSDEVVQQLLDHIKRQEEFNQELLKQLDQQQRYIEERLNERDKTLMESLREVQETKRLIAAAQEEEKKGFFARLFGK